MDNTIAILGRQPELGVAELESLYGASRVSPINPNAIRLDIMPCAVDFKRLGGTVKLCKLLTILDTTNWKEVEQFLIKVSPSHAEHMPAGKMHLGLSAYGLDVSPQQLLATGLKIKKAINKSSGRTVRLVPNKSRELNTAQVIHNKLTSPNGWELVFVSGNNQTYVAQTLFVQDIASYSQRDFGRPKRDARVGMLPPKLAQILINLAIGQSEFEKTLPELSGDICRQPEDEAKLRSARSGIRVLDPFCGTGVLLQEALFMGYAAYGTDIDPRMIEFSEKNLSWFISQRHLDRVTYLLATADATTYQWQQPFDTVASETYLGRPFTSQPTAEVLAQTVSDCNLIIKKFLKNIHSQLPSGFRLCLAIPAWQTLPGKFRHLPLVDLLNELGYNRVRFQHIGDKELLYYRADQIVARELLVITRI